MPITVERNSVSLEFVQTEFSRGDNKGKSYPSLPKITDANRSQVLDWVGKEIVDEILSSRLKQKAQGWYNEATEDDGTFKEDVFAEFAKNFSARGESIPELKEKIDELLEQFNTAMGGENPDYAAAKKIGEEIKSCKIAINSKKRKTKEEEAVAATV